MEQLWTKLHMYTSFDHKNLDQSVNNEKFAFAQIDFFASFLQMEQGFSR